jgi:hypothetical protein
MPRSYIARASVRVSGPAPLPDPFADQLELLKEDR